ncbi:hypothetical protein ABTD85_23160, partial [Acinetobacter baumannii]
LHMQVAQKILGDLEDKSQILSQVQAIFDYPEWQPFFGPNALAEVSIGSADDLIRLDRLVLEASRVMILDYKTTNHPPQT